MNRWLIVTIVALMLSPFSRANGQPSLLARSGIGINIISGRIRQNSPLDRYPYSNTSTRNRHGEIVSESLSVRTRQGAQSIHYTVTQQDRIIEINLNENGENEVHIHQTAPDESENNRGSSLLPSIDSLSQLVPVYYYQPANGPIELTIGFGSNAQTYTEQDLWHLLLLHPELCDKHLLPLLELINNDWNLLNDCDQIVDTMISNTTLDFRVNRDRWEALVAQLDSPRFQDRQTADRQLREEGGRTLGFLNQLNVADLSGEQRSRIRRIKIQLTSYTADTPQSVATEISGNPEIWFSLLTSESAERRVLAFGELQNLLNNSLRSPFSPHASPETRATQLEAIAAELGYSVSRTSDSSTPSQAAQ